MNERPFTVHRTGISIASMNPMTGIHMPDASILAQLQKTCTMNVLLQGLIWRLAEPQNRIQDEKSVKNMSRDEGNPSTTDFNMHISS